MVSSVCKNVKNGSIVLFHNDTQNTPEAVNQILKTLSKEGYRFVTVEQLILKKDYWIDSAGCQHSNTQN